MTAEDLTGRVPEERKYYDICVQFFVTLKTNNENYQPLKEAIKQRHKAENDSEMEHNKGFLYEERICALLSYFPLLLIFLISFFPIFFVIKILFKKQGHNFIFFLSVAIFLLFPWVGFIVLVFFGKFCHIKRRQEVRAEFEAQLK